MGFINWYGEQDGKGSRMALICGLVKGKSLGVLQAPGSSAIEMGRQEAAHKDGYCT